jgi:hypothetical protein
MDTVYLDSDQKSTLEIPTAEEVFDRPYDPPPPLPAAWTRDSVAVELANRECARPLVNTCLYDPPITEEEIDQYARRCRISRAAAESRIRSERRGPWES